MLQRLPASPSDNSTSRRPPRALAAPPRVLSRERPGHKPVPGGRASPFRLLPQDGAEGQEGGRPRQDGGEVQGPEGEEGRLERRAQPQEEEDPHVSHLPPAQDPAAAAPAQVPPEERAAEEQAGPLCHHQVPPDHGVGHEEDRG